MKANESKISESWDPLEDSQADHGILSAAQKRQIQNILKSYTGYYDIFAELIQNALDAVERRIQEEDENYEPKIWINIDIQKGKISVIDNGCGMSETEFKQFLRPNFSFKKANINRGNKGVGATYLAYGFNHLEIGTKYNGQVHYGVLRRGREWVDDHSDSMPSPRVNMIEPTDEKFEEIDQGSSMAIQLVGNSIRPRDLSWVGATTASQWLSILRVHSPLGGVYICGSQPSPVRAIVKVIDSEGNTSLSELNGPRFLYPTDVLTRLADIREYIDDRRRRLAAAQDVSRLPQKFTQLNGIWGEWTFEEILDEGSTCPIRPSSLDSSDTKLVTELGLKLKIFLGCSIDLWDEYNDHTLGLRKGHRILHGGIQLATRNMPQGQLLTIPMTRNIGMQHQAHILIHFENAEPDLGRKGFQPEVVDVARKLSAIVLRSFINNYYSLLRKPGGVKSYTDELEIQDWKNQQENREKEFPLVIKGIGLFMPTEELPITSEPLVEQDVVALFNQMLSAGVIRGIQIISSSTHKQYDGLYRILMEEPFEKFMISKDNPLGLDTFHFYDRSQVRSVVKVLEYKYNLDGLIEELQAETKSAEDIGLVVAWELGIKWRELFDVVSYLDEDTVHRRVIHGATHSFIDSMTGASTFEAIILKDLIGYLDDPKAEQGRQRSKLNLDE